METIYQSFRQTAAKYPDNEAVAGYKGGGWQPVSYRELEHGVNELAAGLAKSGLSAGERVAFMIDNSPEWVMVDLASAALGAVTVPIHTTYGPHYISYMVEHSGARIFLIDKKYYEKYKEEIDKLPVERTVVIDRDTVEPFGGLITAEAVLPAVEVLPDDPHTIIYTSGTTGMPKGVMLSHRNIVADVNAALERVPVGPDDRFLSFLPLAHALERTAGYYAPLFQGAAIYYARSKETLKDDLGLVHPTILISVPRVFEKFYDAVLDAVSHGSAFKKKMFEMAIDDGSARRQGPIGILRGLRYAALNKLVLQKIRTKLGGRMRFAISGGSALGAHIGKFFADLGLVIIEGYGLTETSPVVSVNTLDNYKFGTVGFPLSCINVKLADDGEILVKGESVMAGYWQDEAATQAAFDAEGWFKTGDLGEFDADGFLVITGRKKELIVLSTGKNVAPVPIEQELELNRFISQAMVYGDNQKHIAALIVPDFDELARWAKEQNIPFDLSALITDERVIKLYEHEMKEALNHFPEYEQVRVFTLIAEPFTQENDLLTPTLKLKRISILKRHLAAA